MLKSNQNAKQPKPVCRCVRDPNYAPYKHSIQCASYSGDYSVPVRIHFHAYCGVHCCNYQHRTHPLFGHYFPFVWCFEELEAECFDQVVDCLPDGTFKFKPHKEGEEQGYDYNPGYSALELAQCNYDNNVERLKHALKSYSEELFNDVVGGTTVNAVKEAYLWQVNYWKREVATAESEMGKAMTLAA
jgi:hypothetical protein